VIYIEFVFNAVLFNVVFFINKIRSFIMSLVNTTIKPFKAQAFHNGKFVEITEANLKGKWSAFVFYPADFTFVCPTEICQYSDKNDQFAALDTQLIGCSIDSHFTHMEYTKKDRKKGGLGPMNMPLLSDLTH
jgi:peroxiredoxin (alkyl hydroperoxide reductase subunit C)